MTNFQKCRYGIFVHYVPYLTMDAEGNRICDIQKAADTFDMESFLADLTAMRVEYVIFTAWHAMSNPLYPSRVMEQYRPGHSAGRDLIGELVQGCRRRGIRVILYTHPRDGMEYEEEGKEATGWGKGKNPNGYDPNWETFDFDRWNTFICALYGELAERYGRDIDGLFIDEGSPAGDSWRVVDYPRLHRTIKEIAPHVTTIPNFYGDLYGLDVGMKEYGPGWNEFRNPDGAYWPAYVNPVAAVISANWTADAPANENTLRYTPEDLFRYTILQASSNRNGGGVAWASGPYSGGGWEKDVREALVQVGEKLHSIREAVFDTVPSYAFPTCSGTRICDLQWGTATVSAERRKEYLHILKPIRNGRIDLGKPENGEKLENPIALSGRNMQLSLQCTPENAYTLFIEGTPDPLDTVISLDIVQGGCKYPVKYWNDTSANIQYTGSWEYSRWERNCGDHESDVHITEENGASYSFVFGGRGFEILGGRHPEHGRADVYVDHRKVGEIDGYAESYQPRQVLFAMHGLYGREHRVQVIKTAGRTMEVDAVCLYSACNSK